MRGQIGVQEVGVESMRGVMVKEVRQRQRSSASETTEALIRGWGEAGLGHGGEGEGEAEGWSGERGGGGGGGPHHQGGGGGGGVWVRGRVLHCREEPGLGRGEVWRH